MLADDEAAEDADDGTGLARVVTRPLLNCYYHPRQTASRCGAVGVRVVRCEIGCWALGLAD